MKRNIQNTVQHCSKFHEIRVQCLLLIYIQLIIYIFYYYRHNNISIIINIHTINTMHVTINRLTRIL